MKPKIAAKPRANVDWLSEAREVRHALSLTRPYFVRAHHIFEEAFVPRPSVPFPEWHPYCEFHLNLEGRVIQYIGGEEIERGPGSLMILGAGTPHYAMFLSSPQRAVTVYFMPLLFLEMGPEDGGALILSRFMSPQRITDRVITLPEPLRQEFTDRFSAMQKEWQAPGLGTEVKMRALLADAVVALLRWEEASGHSLRPKGAASVDWIIIARTMRYIHDHSDQPLYTADVAKIAGVSAGRLQTIFQQAIGMSWLTYLRSRRIAHAMSLLLSPNARVTEVALEVGFETLSHFNASFRNFTGMAPTDYVRRAHKTSENEGENR